MILNYNSLNHFHDTQWFGVNQIILENNWKGLILAIKSQQKSQTIDICGMFEFLPSQAVNYSSIQVSEYDE